MKNCRVVTDVFNRSGLSVRECNKHQARGKPYLGWFSVRSTTVLDNCDHSVSGHPWAAGPFSLSATGLLVAEKAGSNAGRNPPCAVFKYFMNVTY